MAAMVKSPFSFIAFSQDTGEMLGYGKNAAEALAQADLAAPGDALIAFRAGPHEDWFWVAKVPLHQAQPVFEALEDEERPSTRLG